MYGYIKQTKEKYMDILLALLMGYLFASYFISGLFIKDWIFAPDKLPIKGTLKRILYIIGMPIVVVGIIGYVIWGKTWGS